jgi:D-apionolactonase
MHLQSIMVVPKEIWWYGRKEPIPEIKTYKAGALSVEYASGSLRNIRVGTHEVVRMIYFALRDHNWGTIIPEIRNEKITVQPAGFDIAFQAVYRQENINFIFQVAISGTPDSVITYDIEGKALFEFRTNRTGFCLLHPVEDCAGKPCEVTHSDGKKENFKFPELISPHQPVRDITGMIWEIDNNLRAEVKFEGEIFEMEDQRNWTDNSYKTYCRPLDLPYPFTLEKGDIVKQRIVLSLSGEVPQEEAQAGKYHFTYDEKFKYPLPLLGIGQPQSLPPLSEKEATLIKAVGFDYYDVRVAFESSWISELKNSIEEAIALRLAIRLRLKFTGNFEIEIGQIDQILGAQKHLIVSVLILEAGKLVTSDEFLQKLLEPLRNIFPDVSIGAGTLGFFTGLNRNRIGNQDIDFVSYSINPQVHAFDNRTLVENLRGQSATVKSAKSITAGKQVQLSAVTFKMQKNPSAVGSEVKISNRFDPRQMSLFGAGWTLASIKQLSEAGADAVTYYETIGEMGIIQGDSGSKYPDMFFVDEGAVFPMYYVFRNVLKQKKGTVLLSRSSHPLVFEGLVMENNGRKTIMLASFTGQTIEVMIDGLSPEAKVLKLDEKNVFEAMYHHDTFIKSSYCEIKIEPGTTAIKVRPFGLVFISD